MLLPDFVSEIRKFLGQILMTFYVGLISILMVLLEDRISVVIPYVISYYFKNQIK